MATDHLQSGPNTKWWGRTDVDAARDRLRGRLWRTVQPEVASPGCNPRYVVDLAGACVRARVVDDVHRAPKEDGSPFMCVGKGPMRHQAMIWIRYIVRCRRCVTCMNHRSDLIAERTRREFLHMERRCGRAWFVSLTLSPDVRRDLANAVFKAAGFPKERQVIAMYDNGDTRTIWGPYARRMGLIAGIKKLGQAFVKSLRKRTKLKARQLRYLTVVELHKDGTPHLHAIVIESGGTREVKKRLLEACWPHGFIKAKLIDKNNDGYSRSAYYTAKYLTKQDVHSRLMMSHHWGNPGHVPDVRIAVSRPLFNQRFRPARRQELPQVPSGRLKPEIRDPGPDLSRPRTVSRSGQSRAQRAERAIGLSHSKGVQALRAERKLQHSEVASRREDEIFSTQGGKNHLSTRPPKPPLFRGTPKGGDVPPSTTQPPGFFGSDHKTEEPDTG